MKVAIGLLIGALAMLAISRVGQLMADDIRDAESSAPYLLRACHDGTDRLLFKSKSGQFSMTQGGKEFKISPDANIEKDVCAP